MIRPTYLKGYKYKLNEDYSVNISLLGFNRKTDFITLNDTGLLTIHKNYAWDGAPCAIGTDTFMRGALIHDALYQLIRNGYIPSKYRLDADDVLINVCKEDGMRKFRRYYVYKAVRIFGGGAIEPRKIYTMKRR